MGLSYSPRILEDVLKQIDSDIESPPSFATTITTPILTQKPAAYACHKFVDDLHFGGSTVEECINNYNFGIYRFEKFGFTVNHSKTFSNITEGWSNTGKFLGHNYHPDHLHWNFPKIAVSAHSTRAELTSALASLFYDPYGLIIEETLLIKKLQTKVFNNTADWDSPAPRDIVEEVNHFLTTKANLQVMMGRQIETETLYVFVDASRDFWCVDIRDQRLTRVYATNGKVPTEWTIPRAELEALHKGVLITEKLLPDLPTRDIVYLSDSLVTIQRLRRNSPNSPWEERRLQKIIAITHNQNAEVRHIHTEYNLADRGTKEKSSVETNTEVILKHIQDAGAQHSRIFKSIACNLITRTTAYVPREEPIIRNSQLQSQLISTTLQRIKESQQNYDLKETTNTIRIDGILYRTSDVAVIDNKAAPLQQAIVPEQDKDLIQSIITSIHRSCGHLDAARTMANVRKHFYIPKLRRAIQRITQNCHTCIVNKTKRTWHHYASTVPWANGLWRIVGIDHATLPTTQSGHNGYNGYLSLTDYITKFTVTVINKSRSAPEDITQLNQIFGILGYPTVLMFDGSTSFCNEEFMRFLHTNQIKPFQIAAYAAEAGGFYERPHKTLKELLRARLLETNASSNDWPQHLQLCTAQLNAIPYDLTESRLTPALMNMGYNPRIPGMDMDMEDPTKLTRPSVESIDAQREANMNAYTRFWERRRSDIRQTLFKRGRPIKISIGDKVLVHRPRTDALSPEWHYAGEVIEVEGQSSIKIRLPDGRELVKHRVNVFPVPSPGM